MTIDPNFALAAVLAAGAIVVYIVRLESRIKSNRQDVEASIESNRQDLVRHESVCAERQIALWKELRRNTKLTASLVPAHIVARVDAEIADEEEDAEDEEEAV